ncbi:NUDE protein [Phyllosticta capitalensis]|uniref:NUDE protein n=1 Tax=Phyllosticta capitalensis TaxID=121624 RepID=A0ABR1YJ44_9PEZI
MASATDAPLASPGLANGSLEEQIAYYKSQYESLEAELQDFQQCSREVESELERDIEQSEKRERQLKERLEERGFEVDEWKAKYKQAKTEANGAQNALQKEITTLREQNRAMTLKLRDIEVANDDFERQARNQTSSLEDLEGKYNVAIERGVMLEEEIKVGEQEREDLRIENQRLRDELSDLSIEADIIKEKLRAAEETMARHMEQKTHALVTGASARPRSPVSETSSSATTLSSPTTSTPPPSKSKRSSATTPPSPRFTDLQERKVDRRRPLTLQDNTPRARDYGARSKHSRAPSVPWSSASGRTTPGTTTRRPTASHYSKRSGADGALPRTGSLYQIRGLISKMQKLESRVHNVRSKLPAPTQTPPRASPRGPSAMSNHSNGAGRPAARTRTSGSTTSSAAGGDTGVSRLSFSAAGAKGNSAGLLPGASRPTSQASERSGVSNVSGQSASYKRPPSRSAALPARTNTTLMPTRSNTTGVRPKTAGNMSARPPSRGADSFFSASLGFGRSSTISQRPSSRQGGNHTPTPSLSHSNTTSFSSSLGPPRPTGRSRANTVKPTPPRRNFDDDTPTPPKPKARDFGFATPVSRKPDFTRSMGPGSGIPTPGGGSGIPTPSALPRRPSRTSRRSSVDALHGPRAMPPPGSAARERKLSEVGETW